MAEANNLLLLERRFRTESFVQGEICRTEFTYDWYGVIGYGRLFSPSSPFFWFNCLTCFTQHHDTTLAGEKTGVIRENAADVGERGWKTLLSSL